MKCQAATIVYFPIKNDSFKFIKAGECWAYKIGTKAVNKDIIYNITETLRKDII